MAAPTGMVHNAAMRRSARLLRLVVFGSVMGSVVTLGGCSHVQAVRGSGDLVTAHYEVGEFDGVAVSHAFELTIVRGDEPGLTVTCDDNIEPLVDVHQDGSTLKVGMRNSANVRDATQEATLTVRGGLGSLRASGATMVNLVEIEQDRPMKITTSGASEVHGHVRAPRVDMVATGATSLSLSGHAAQCGLRASGASAFRMQDMNCERAAVQLSGASSSEIGSVASLGPVVLSGASSLTYAGNPALGDIHVGGGSSIKPR